MSVRLLVLVAALLTAVSCSSEPAVLNDVGIADGLTIEVVIEDLVGPTQFVLGGADDMLVAVINGGEDDQLGQVLDYDLSSGEFTVVAERLDKPTGVAQVGQYVWVMERDQLSRLDRQSSLATTARDVILRDLPNNGRSEGTLTVTPDQQILFNTSGSKRGADVVDGSGRLFTISPSAVRDSDPDGWQDLPVEVASGFKHAYAHVYDGDVLWVTEMTDGRFDGEPAADEVLRVVAHADHGWPYCVGDNRVVEEFGGTADRCADTPPSLATFAPGATPTSITISPFDDHTLLVALSNEGRIVAIDTTSDDPSDYSDVATGLIGPQHLVATDDAVYVSEFGTGRILRLTAQ